jgi:hypothetical protein
MPLPNVYMLYIHKDVKRIEWNPAKGAQLQVERGICFEDVVDILEQAQYIDRINHPNQKQYPNQEIFLVEIRGYMYAVPFVEDDEKIFLKTIFATRKYTKRYSK